MIKYNETEKLLLLSQYITSGLDAYHFAGSRGIPYTTFRHILRCYGHPDTSSISELMKQAQIPTTVEELQAQLARERKAHAEELQRLKHALAQEQVRSLANSTMIDLAEKKFNIRIRKNSDAK
uniref:Transposase n=1 Tax=Prevotella sp. GTC17259 TaxID=3236795 RepID=A0AB33J5M9_9BACT